MARPLIFSEKDSGGIIQVANIKGGVGKSTIATNLAVSFAKKGKTLLIDLDGQGSATAAFGIDPAYIEHSSSELLTNRFYPPFENENSSRLKSISKRLKYEFKRTTSSYRIVTRELNSIIREVQPGLDLIGGTASLFCEYSPQQVYNLLFNLQGAQREYKYIILDTPSNWNGLIKTLFTFVDLSLIPVTLNAFVTRSLKDYLYHLKNLIKDETNVKIRIIKNEVYGKIDSKKIGKVRTMHENREFLQSLVETVEYRSKGSRLYLSESIVFDLEIPESSVIRNSQDKGTSVFENLKYNAVQRAFSKLTRDIQTVLNQFKGNPNRLKKSVGDLEKNLKLFVKAAVFLLVVFWGQDLYIDHVPSPLVLGKYEKLDDSSSNFIYTGGPSLYKFAKYAICRHRAIVPSHKQVEKYLQEVLTVHNLNVPDKERITAERPLPPGTSVEFFPPTSIINPNFLKEVEFFEYFLGTVDDPFSYVTGLWAERGTGGSIKHEGIDVATRFGTNIISPVGGVAHLKISRLAGRTVAVEVKSGGVLLFAHMDKRFVKEGQRIKKGQVIGTVGMTGRTSGPHVHVGYGIKFPTGTKIGKYRYKWTDPALWFYRQSFYQNNT